MLMMRGLGILILSLLLGACGYHLRGYSGSEWQLGKLFVAPGGTVSGEVRRLLSLGGVPMVDSQADADSVLTITRDEQERQVLSVDPDTGKVREFELTVKTGFQVAAANGAVLLEDNGLSLERDYTFDETAALGKYEEEGALYTELRKDLAAAIIRRLRPLRLPAPATR